MQVFIDQTTYGVFTTWLYFYVIAAFNGASLAATHAKVAREFVPLLLDNWKVWPLVTLVNFAFVPPKLQVLFANVISIFCTSASEPQPQRTVSKQRAGCDEALRMLTVHWSWLVRVDTGTAYVVAITR